MQGIFKIKEHFQSKVGVIQVFLREGFNSFGLEKLKRISKIPRFRGGFKLGLYFSWFFRQELSKFSQPTFLSLREVLVD